jgi:hypothetical protein
MLVWDGGRHILTSTFSIPKSARAEYEILETVKAAVKPFLTQILSTHDNKTLKR